MKSEVWNFKAVRAAAIRLQASGMEEDQALETAIVGIRQMLAEEDDGWETPEAAGDACYERMEWTDNGDPK
jgi:hypothetical protein